MCEAVVALRGAIFISELESFATTQPRSPASDGTQTNLPSTPSIPSSFPPIITQANRHLFSTMHPPPRSTPVLRRQSLRAAD